jgi:stage IV sporulation protein FB
VNRGWLTIATVSGAPIRLHWSIPIAAFVLGRFQIVPAFWAGFVLLILIHELGHALLVLRYRLGLFEIRVHGLGGECHHRTGTPFQESAIAWGGVLGQLVVLIATQVVLLVLGPPTSTHTAQLVHVFTESNLWLMAINLLPIAPLDGAKAWPLLPMIWEKLRKRSPARGPLGQKRSVQDELRSLEKLDTRAESPDQKTDRIVRDLISRTTQSKSD